MEDSVTTPLLPCPFCPDGGEPYIDQIGNEHTIVKGFDSGCRKCRIKKKDRVERHSLEWLRTVVVSAWNTRAESADVKKLRDLNAELVKALERCKFFAQGCERSRDAIIIEAVKSAIIEAAKSALEKAK
jgi:hypothetical protein